MIKLQESQIANILPESLAKRAEVQALSFALCRAVERLMRYCENIGVFAAIETASDDVLDRLAMELDTQYYDDALSLQSKRELVKNTMLWYMRAGTPQAVEELVTAVFGEGKIKEWYEYGDDPYFFKIITNAQMTPEMNARFSSMLRKVKNAKSHIRTIEIHRTAEQMLHAGAYVLSRCSPPAIMDGYGIRREVTEKHYAGIVGEARMYPEAIMDGLSMKGMPVQGYVHSGVGMTSKTRGSAVMDGLSEMAGENSMR